MNIPERLIVTMTSWHKRIGNVKRVLETILNQTVLPDKIILNLCTEDFPQMEKSLPDELNKFLDAHSDIIETYWYIENYKAWKKHLHALEVAGDDDLILCIDDDHLYTPNFIEYMYVSYCYYNKEFPVTYYTSKLFHNLWSFFGPGTLYKKSHWGKNYKKYLTQDVLHKTYEDIIITMMFAMNNVMLLPMMFDLPDEEEIIFDNTNTFSHNIDDRVLTTMQNTLIALEDSFDRFYFEPGHDHKYTPHFWQIFIDMVKHNKELYYNVYPQVKYAIDAFETHFLSGTVLNVNKEEAQINKHRYTKEDLVGSGNRVIITISSWTKRISNVTPVLETIAENTILPDVIYINLAKSDFDAYGEKADVFKNPNIPQNLKDFMSRPGLPPIIINWYDNAALKSWKKHIKVIEYGLKNNRLDDVVLCLDDDVLYKPTYIETMLKSYNYYGRKYPITCFSTCFCQGGYPFCGYGMLYPIRGFKDFDKYMTSEMYFKFPEDNHLLNILNINRSPILPVIGKDFLFIDTNYNEGESNFGNLVFTDEWWASYHDIMAESAKIIENTCQDREELYSAWNPIYYNFTISNLYKILKDEEGRKDEPIFKEVYKAIQTHLDKNPGMGEDLYKLYEKIDNIIL